MHDTKKRSTWRGGGHRGATLVRILTFDLVGAGCVGLSPTVVPFRYLLQHVYGCVEGTYICLSIYIERESWVGCRCILEVIKQNIE